MLKNCTRAARVSWFAEKYSAKIQFTSVKVDKVFEQSGFQRTVENPKPKQLLIHTYIFINPLSEGHYTGC